MEAAKQIPIPQDALPVFTLAALIRRRRRRRRLPLTAVRRRGREEKGEGRSKRETLD